MDKIIIKDLLLRGVIGINPDERKNKQDILINLVLFTDIRAAAATDNIEQATNYKTITKRVIEHVENASDYLVEKLVTDIAHLILTEFSVMRVQVRVEKPTALRFAGSVGIEIERGREDLLLH
ncbi:MAG: dihydroneopterin aldolase [Anaerolineae bacterium]|nr:dihydroneopterin aldolase [Anaerolineae bacterium]